MANIRATEIRKGMVLKIDGGLWYVMSYTHITPGNKRAINQIQLRNIQTGARKDMRLPSGAQVETAFLDKRPCTFLYKDASGAHFMDSETYEQFTLTPEAVQEVIPFITEETAIQVTFHEGEPVSVDLPAAVELTVVEAEEAVRGDTATNVTKNAVLETGHKLKVPNHIKVGDKIKVSTETGEFLSRAN